MDFKQFIAKYSAADPTELRLKAHKFSYDFDVDLAITQIECRKKSNNKLSEIISNPDFLFPDSVSSQQASHQAVAWFHSSLIDVNSEKILLDMTAGLGIDSFYFARNPIEITAVELNPLKHSILNKNISTLQIKNIKTVLGDSLEFLKSDSPDFDIIFVDPARRDENNKRLYNLRDCSPDVFTNQDLLLKKSKRILIKASPLLDISQTIKDFPNIKSIRSVGVKGECKEVLIELIKDYSSSHIQVEAIDLDEKDEILNRFTIPDFNPSISGKIKPAIASLSDLSPGVFILEPSAMIMKIAPWNEICQRFNSKKLGNSSNIFISDSYPENFPGRVTKFEKIIKKSDRKTLCGLPATVVSRNYPISASQLRESFKLKEGDNNFIYATRIGEKPVLLFSQNL